jgi:hypothetical protein
MGCRFDRPKRVWVMVKSIIRSRGGGRRSTCSWGFPRPHSLLSPDHPFCTRDRRNLVDLNSVTHRSQETTQLVGPIKVGIRYTETRTKPNLPQRKWEPIIIGTTLNMTKNPKGFEVKVRDGISPGSNVYISNGRTDT